MNDLCLTTALIHVVQNKCLREQIATLQRTRNLAVYHILFRLLCFLRLALPLAHRLILRFLLLNTGAKSSFIQYKLRFFASVCLALISLATLCTRWFFQRGHDGQ